MITTCILTATLLISNPSGVGDGTYDVVVEEYKQLDDIEDAYGACEYKFGVRIPILVKESGARYFNGTFTISNGEPTYTNDTSY